MLKGITIGQYYNTHSIIHLLDPRTKIIALILLMVAIFTVGSPEGYICISAFAVICIIASRVPVLKVLKGIKPILLLVIFTALINLFFGPGETVLWQYGFIVIRQEALFLAIKMLLRVVLLVLFSSLLTLTTSPMNLTYGLEKLLRPLEKIKFPAHEVAMMMSIALRFIPTLAEETEKIMKAQASRGNDFENGSIIKKAKALIPLFVPLFVSAFRRADDLAMAMECRCYRGGVGKTSFRELKYTKKDLVAFIAVVVVICSALVF